MMVLPTPTLDPTMILARLQEVMNTILEWCVCLLIKIASVTCPTVEGLSKCCRVNRSSPLINLLRRAPRHASGAHHATAVERLHVLGQTPLRMNGAGKLASNSP